MKFKKHHFTVLSNQICIHKNCGKRIKQNLVDRKKNNFLRCYTHFKELEFTKRNKNKD